LDDPVIKYLPEFRTANKERSDKITVRMLINNTSGLYGGVTKNRQDTEKSMELLMLSLQSIFLKREPGSSYEYSNAAFSVAGLLISRVSGMTYPKYLEKHIFEPLEMGRSMTDPADFDALQVLYGHHFGINGGIPAEKGIESVEMAPAGSMLRSSAEDMGNYLVALLNDGSYKGSQILSKKSIDELWSPQISFPGLTCDQGVDGSKFNYGLGWMIAEVEGRTIINHGGSRKTMSSMTILDPKRQLAATILFNLDYNFLDNYRFQSEFNILNNLFHLLEKEELTDFGNPRIQDPTLNDYELRDVMKQRFIG
ncbi:MAG: beta-lactamase family protein, partial [Cyclobacteriaceae bacterium]|nr:beta-lactamase family protein [Cyclobacteriaceae bacterium]